MAKFESSTFGKMSGRLGKVVAVKRNGKNFLREYTVPANPQTLKQQANRMKFRFVNRCLTPLRQVIKRGYLDTQAFPKVCSKVLKTAVEGEYPDFAIDFSKLQLADGTLQPVGMVTAETRKAHPKLSSNGKSRLKGNYKGMQTTKSRWCFLTKQQGHVFFTKISVLAPTKWLP